MLFIMYIIYVVDKQNGQVPLHWACTTEHVIIVHLLLKHMPNGTKNPI